MFFRVVRGPETDYFHIVFLEKPEGHRAETFEDIVHAAGGNDIGAEFVKHCAVLSVRAPVKCGFQLVLMSRNFRAREAPSAARQTVLEQLDAACF